MDKTLSPPTTCLFYYYIVRVGGDKTFYPYITILWFLMPWRSAL